MDDQLLLRYLSQECTEEELLNIDQWISTNSANAKWLFEMERIWTLRDELRFSDKKEIENAYNRFVNSLNQNEEVISTPRRLKLPVWLKCMAAVIIIGLLSVNLYYTIKDESISINTIEVPIGQRASLILSDGTKVWLNSETKLSYPSQFSNKLRTVNLQGEGYFEVMCNGKTPFVVNGNQLSVKVLGTKFNMKSYENETTSVILKEGKVEVYTTDNENKITLHPNEQVRYSKATGMLFSNNVDAYLGESWRNGELTFIDNSLEEIMNTLERKFVIEVVITDQNLAGEIFTCRAKPDATLLQMLELLKDTRRLDYKIENRKVIILKK